MAVVTSRRLLSRALVAAVVTAVFFALKDSTIAAGRDAFDDPLVNGFFYVGAVALAVTFALAGAALARRPGRRGRLRGAALGLAVGVVGGVVIAAVFTALLPADESWVYGEVNLWAIAVLTLVTLLVLRSRASAPRRAA
ncbi:hypothetical protein [Microlunatus antarcticus]|uniref:Integral membrane protein n=1 Tax=Microlunatus antarcticus TaxID=53388 RepID=A0A7W5JUY8_9ACTN|nr:hypothetical protein [Microlunatus antarcticus]MBB3326847.1 hypothetical protein [Microlunatus antarcticus]